MTRNARIALLLAAVVVAVVAAVTLGAGGDDEEPATTGATASTPATVPARPRPRPAPVFRLRDGRPVGGVGRLEVESGERVRFVVAADTEQEVHVHGYEIERTVPAGGRTAFSFRATSQGVYEIESHTSGEAIARLRVVP